MIEYIAALLPIGSLFIYAVLLSIECGATLFIAEPELLEVARKAGQRDSGGIFEREARSSDLRFAGGFGEASAKYRFRLNASRGRNDEGRRKSRFTAGRWQPCGNAHSARISAGRTNGEIAFPNNPETRGSFSDSRFRDSFLARAFAVCSPIFRMQRPRFRGLCAYVACLEGGNRLR